MKFSNHPIVRVLLRNLYSLDPDKVAEGVSYILEKRPDIVIYFPSNLGKKTLVKLRLSDISFKLTQIPPVRESEEQLGMKIRSYFDVKGFSPHTPLTSIKYGLAVLVALALAAELHKRFNDVPMIIPPHITTLRRAHEGDFRLLEETYKAVRGLNPEKLPRDRTEVIAKDLMRFRYREREEDVRKDLKRLREIKESLF